MNRIAHLFLIFAGMLNQYYQATMKKITISTMPTSKHTRKNKKKSLACLCLYKYFSIFAASHPVCGKT